MQTPMNEYSTEVQIKVNGYTSTSVPIFISAALHKGGQLLNERICSPRSKFFPLKVYPILEGLHLSREAKKDSQKLFPFIKMKKKIGSILNT